MQLSKLKSEYREELVETYHDTGALSAHGLITMTQSPAHFHHKYILKNFDEPTPAMRFGTLAHSAILEPERFLKNYLVMPDLPRNTKVGKEAHDDFIKNLKPENIAVSADDLEKVRAMIDRIHSHPKAGPLLSGGKAELSGYWQDLNYGHHCKIRPDYLHHDGFIVDLKTTRDASEKEFSRAIGNFSYDIQAAWYTDGNAIIQNLNRDDLPFLFVAIETSAPFGIGVYSASNTLISFGRKRYQAAAQRYFECKQANKWPSYSEEIKEIDLPRWMN